MQEEQDRIESRCQDLKDLMLLCCFSRNSELGRKVDSADLQVTASLENTEITGQIPNIF